MPVSTWTRCLRRRPEERRLPEKAAAKVAADVDLGSKVGAGGTPAFFVDGQFVNVLRRSNISKA